MFGNLTAAFGLTVLCLAPILLVGLIFPFILMRFTRGKNQDDGKRNPVAAAMVYARLYVISLVVMVMLTMAFWWAFLLVSSPEVVVDFASQSIPLVEDAAVEDAVEPVATLNADDTAGGSN